MIALFIVTITVAVWVPIWAHLQQQKRRGQQPEAATSSEQPVEG